MKRNRTTLTAALCCMAFASGSALAANDGSTSNSGSNMGNTTSSSNMNRGGTAGMGTSGYHSGSMDQQTVRQVQQALSDKGHNPGPIDGIMGPRTRSALQDYQRSQNITAGGLDSRTLESLGVQASAGSRGGMGNDSGSSAGGTGGAYGGSGGAASGTGSSSGMGSDANRSRTPGSTGTTGSDASRSGSGSTTSPSGSSGTGSAR